MPGLAQLAAPGVQVQGAQALPRQLCIAGHAPADQVCPSARQVSTIAPMQRVAPGVQDHVRHVPSTQEVIAGQGPSV